jgi:hypothetical protein
MIRGLTSIPASVCLCTVEGKKKRSPDARPLSYIDGNVLMISLGANMMVEKRSTQRERELPE